MKKTLIALAFVPALFSFQKRQVTPKEIGATYNTCSDSTVMNLSVNVTTNLSSKTYAFSGSKTGSTFNMTIVDYNGGLVVAGDSIRVTAANYNICGTAYTLRTDAIPTVVISGNKVDVYYTDCILPLNGTSGSMYVKFTQ